MYYFFFDASALAKRYTDEVGSNKIDFFFDNVPFVWDAMDLIENHSLNSVDAIVLRSALDMVVELRSTGDTLVLVASDQRLLRAARAEGLQIFNPEIDSQQTLVDWIT